MNHPVVDQRSKFFLNRVALGIARRFEHELDYSHASIRIVDEILDAYHDDFRQRREEDGLRGVAVAFAAYIVRVIERHSTSGVWLRTVPVYAVNALPYVWKGRRLFPYRWCLRRMLDGGRDDVWRRYRATVLAELGNRKQGKPKRRMA